MKNELTVNEAKFSVHPKDYVHGFTLIQAWISNHKPP